MRVPKRVRLRCEGKGYRAIRHWLYPMPVVPLPVRLSEEEPSINSRFLLDTGAAVSVLRDPLLIEQLQLESREPLLRQTIVGVDGRSQECPVHELDISLKGLWIRVPFAVQPVKGESSSLLGHYDFFDRFQAIFYRTRHKGVVEVNLSI